MNKETCWYITYVDDRDEPISTYATVPMLCSECNYYIGIEGINACNDLGFKHCPNCGRKILGVKRVDDLREVMNIVAAGLTYSHGINRKRF